MKRRPGKRRGEQRGEHSQHQREHPAEDEADVDHESDTPRHNGPLTVEAHSRRAIASASDVVGNAIGDGSIATHVDNVTVHYGAGAAGRRTRRRLAPPPPLGEIADRKTLRQMLTHYLVNSERSQSRPVFLEGYGGAGKTTLAIQACSGSRVSERFPGGVVWTTIGQSRLGSDLAGHIGDLCEHISGDRPTTTNPSLAGAFLGELLGDGEPVLLVIDDVWTAAQVQPFLMGASDCGRLFTTRNKGVAPEGAAVIEVGAMTASEAWATASAGIPELDADSIEQLLTFAKGWPVLLGLINAALREHVAAGGPVSEVASWLESLIIAEGPEALDASVPGDVRPGIASTVSASLALLSESERERYLDLAIFREDVEVPEPLALRFWQSTGDVDAQSGRELLNRLGALRLVSRRWSDGGPAIAVHDVLLSYLTHKLSSGELSLRHQLFVEAMRQMLPEGAPVDHWWRLPEGERFAIQHLPYHLNQAELFDQHSALACDLRWIERQISDLGSVVPAVTTLSAVATSQAAQLRKTLERESALLTPEQVPTATRATLASRLEGNQTLQSLVTSYNASAEGAVLANRWPLPDTRHAFDEGHNGPIGDCAVSPDGRLLATASDDRLVVLWSLPSMRVYSVLRGHRQRARACEFSPDGSKVVSASMDGTLKIWDVAGGTLLQSLGDGDCRMLGCAWSNDGRLVSSASDDGRVLIWWADTGDPYLVLESDSGHEWDCSFSPSGTELVSAGEDGALRVWDLAQGNLIAAIPAHSGRIRSCTFDRTGRYILSGGNDLSVKLFDRHQGKRVRELRGHTDRVRMCCFSRDGALVATAAEDRTVRLWDLRHGREVECFRGHTDWVGGCAFTADGLQLVSCGGDIAIRFWNIATAEAVQIVAPTHSAVECCAFTTDYSHVVSGGADGVTSIWNSQSGVTRLTLPSHEGRALTCSPFGEGLITGGADGALRLWDTEDGELKLSYSRHSGRVWACATSTSQGLVCSVGEDGLLKVHDLTSGALLREFKGHAGHAMGCAFSPDGALIASVGDDAAVRLWDVASGRQVRVIETEGENALWTCSFASDGRTVLAAGEPSGRITMWSTASGNVLRSVSVGPGRITSCALSPDGKLLAACGEDALLSVWDLESGEPRAGVRVAYPLRSCCWGLVGRSLLVAAAGSGGLYMFEYSESEVSGGVSA